MLAVVTGASAGIGEAVARRVAREPGWELILVARREDRLRALAAELPRARTVGVDLRAADAPARVRAAVGDRLALLVNNAGSSWRATFAEGGYANVRRTMELNFDAVVRLTEALLPALRADAPSSMVNVASVAGRVGRPGSGAYGASKFALAGWSDALRGEEAPHGVHVGLVLPGFIATEGFPHEGLRRRPHTRWLVSGPERVAEAVWACGPGGRAERYVPRPWAVVPALRHVAPGLVRRATG